MNLPIFPNAANLQAVRIHAPGDHAEFIQQCQQNFWLVVQHRCFNTSFPDESQDAFTPTILPDLTDHRGMPVATSRTRVQLWHQRHRFQDPDYNPLRGPLIKADYHAAPQEPLLPQPHHTVHPINLPYPNRVLEHLTGFISNRDCDVYIKVQHRLRPSFRVIAWAVIHQDETPTPQQPHAADHRATFLNEEQLAQLLSITGRASALDDGHGTLYAIQPPYNAPIWLDPHLGPPFNPHLLVTGNSRQADNFARLHLLRAVLNGTHTIVIDTDGRYRELGESLGALTVAPPDERLRHHYRQDDATKQPAALNYTLSSLLIILESPEFPPDDNPPPSPPIPADDSAYFEVALNTIRQKRLDHHISESNLHHVIRDNPFVRIDLSECPPHQAKLYTAMTLAALYRADRQLPHPRLVLTDEVGPKLADEIFNHIYAAHVNSRTSHYYELCAVVRQPDLNDSTRHFLALVQPNVATSVTSTYAPGIPQTPAQADATLRLLINNKPHHAIVAATPAEWEIVNLDRHRSTL